jgi:nitrogen fixation protein NifU and related proteins
MSDANVIRDLYEDVILEHSRHPRNRRAIEGCSHVARSENPACGDEICVFAAVNEGGVIEEIAFRGQCCAIATACASVMTEVLIGKTTLEAKRLFWCFRNIVMAGLESPRDGLGSAVHRLSTLAGIRDFPAREKCALLPWQTMLSAVESPKERK